MSWSGLVNRGAGACVASVGKREHVCTEIFPASGAMAEALSFSELVVREGDPLWDEASTRREEGNHDVTGSGETRLIKRVLRVERPAEKAGGSL